MNSRRSTANVLALVYAALVAYASLYPFDGWRWPRDAGWQALLALPWTPWGDLFDLWSNFAGYMPFGLLLAIGRLRSGARLAAAWWVALLLPAVLSYGLEVLQTTIPTRHPSLKDWAMNSAGGGAGALAALVLHRAGLVDEWHALRQRWFERDSEGGLALLALWPLGLLFPTPAPLGLGQIGGGRLVETLSAWFEGLPFLDAMLALVAPAAGDATAPRLTPLAELLITSLGLLAPAVVAFSIVAPGWRRLAMAVGGLLLATLAMTLSTWLNFGPRHALAWITPLATPAALVAAAVAVVLAPMPRAVVIGVGLMALTGLVVGVAQAPADPYFAQSLQAWEQGRFVRFHGLAQWIGWLWPYAAMAWLLRRLAVRG